MQYRQYSIAVLVLITGILPVSTFGSDMTQNILAFASFMLALVLCTSIEYGPDSQIISLPIRIHLAIAAPLIVLWVLLTLATLVHPSLAGLLRLPAYLFASAGAAFILPATLNRQYTYQIFALAGALITLAGLPGLILGPLNIGPLTLPTISSTYSLLGIWEVHNPASIFVQPNPLAFLSGVGFVSALAVIRRARDRHTRLLFTVSGVICAVGVLVTQSRALWGALAVVAALYAVYRFTARNRRVLAATLAIGMGSVAVVMLALSGVLPEPFVLDIYLSHRGAAWAAAIKAIIHRPFIGWGVGNVEPAVVQFSPTGDDLIANSYLRVFAMTGIAGGIAYLVLCANALRCALSRIRPNSISVHEHGFVTLALLVIVLLIQLFEGLTLFGFALLSVFGMLLVGYAQPAERSNHTLTLDLTALSHAWAWIFSREQRTN